MSPAVNVQKLRGWMGLALNVLCIIITRESKNWIYNKFNGCVTGSFYEATLLRLPTTKITAPQIESSVLILQSREEYEAKQV